MGDPRRLGEVLDKLLDNAIKFSQRGQVTLRCRQLGIRGGLATLRFEVQDQGLGMDEARRRSVFGLFEQGDGSSTRQHGGVGMGLAYARRLVGLMGGEIGVESSPGQGSCFWFTVTLEPAKAPEPLSPDAVDPQQALAAAQRLEQLLADDDASSVECWHQSRPALQALLGDRLEAFGQAVEGFEFSVALDLLRRGQSRQRGA